MTRAVFIQVGGGRVSLSSTSCLEFNLWKLRSFSNKSSCCCSDNPAFSLVHEQPFLKTFEHVTHIDIKTLPFPERKLKTKTLENAVTYNTTTERKKYKKICFHFLDCFFSIYCIIICVTSIRDPIMEILTTLIELSWKEYQ